MPTLSQIAPVSGPPGIEITCTGTGFDAHSKVACPSLVETTFDSATTVRARIPEVAGPVGESMLISVYVENADGSRSALLPFTILLPAAKLQTWTTIDAVAAEVPSFRRGGNIGDAAIENWMRSVAQTIAARMIARGLSLKPADWQQPAGDLMPSPAAVLEQINRLGAAARLAGAIGGDFAQGEWGLAKELARAFEREMKLLAEGAYDKLFRPAAATVESGPQFSGGDIETDSGEAEQAFSKTQIF